MALRGFFLSLQLAGAQVHQACTCTTLVSASVLVSGLLLGICPKSPLPMGAPTHWRATTFHLLNCHTCRYLTPRVMPDHRYVP